VIADLTVPRFRECDDRDEVLCDATMVWAVLNVVEDISSASEEVIATRLLRSECIMRIGEFDLTTADLFENVMEAIETDDLERFGLSPPPER